MAGWSQSDADVDIGTRKQGPEPSCRSASYSDETSMRIGAAGARLRSNGCVLRNFDIDERLVVHSGLPSKMGRLDD